MDQILDRLFLGNLTDGQQATTPLTCVLNLSQFVYENSLCIIDAPIPDEMFLPAYEWQALVHELTHQLAQGQTVLVHCRLGVSRAPALVAAYLASSGWHLESALAYVMSKRPCVCVHSETWRGVGAWWEGKTCAA